MSKALSELKLDSSVIDTRTYDNGGRMTTDVLGNGITETRAYRSDNLLSSISFSNTNIGNLTYSWDANKNKTSETIGGVMSGYGFTSAGTAYDDEDRLTGYQRASTTFNQSWSLTSVGDWSSVTTNGTAVTRTHGPTHELLTSGGQNVTTDVKGNQTVLPASLATQAAQLAFAWDYDNKLKSSDIDNNGSADVTFEYDALGRRVARTEGSTAVVYFQADQQTIADYPRGGSASTATYRYVFASYIDEPVVRKTTGTSGTVLYYHRNQQYSIFALTDSSGNVSERYAYTAYGQPAFLNASATVQTSSAAGNRYTYTAREWDATLGLHHFRARWMGGLTGRFLTRDPIGYLDNINSYACSFAFNDLDPLGLYRIVGVIPPPPKSYYVWQPEPNDPGGINGPCFAMDANGQKIQVPCPILPPDDPDGPGYLEGIDMFIRGLDTQKALCGKCCFKGNCNKQTCESGIDEMKFRIITAWASNYGRGGYGNAPGHPVGGYLCWDWAYIFQQALGGMNNPCVQFQVWSLLNPNFGQGNPPDYIIHYVLHVNIGGANDPGCQFSIDDGFDLRGVNTNGVHPGLPWPWIGIDPTTNPPGQPLLPYVPLKF
jgi:RHS repeat-associated protein